MISVSYLFVYINILYIFDQAGTCSSNNASKVWKNKRELFVNAENQNEWLAKTITPYKNMSYGEQLDMKQKRCITFVGRVEYRSKLLGRSFNVKLLRILPSPITTAYRNRDVFCIRRGVDGKDKTVGFIVENTEIGLSYSIRPTKIVTVKESHKKVAQVYEDFIRLSPLKPHIEVMDGGHWGPLLVRSNEAGDIMASVTVQPKGHRIISITEQKEALTNYFLERLPNITLYHQQCFYSNYVRCTSSVAPFILLYGKPYLLETISGYKYHITPGSFFVTNKFGAEVLFNIVAKVAKLKPRTTVLELFSGSGLITLLVSKFVKEAIGIEFKSVAVTDASYFAQLNNIHNVQFIWGTRSRNFTSILKSLNLTGEIVAIVNDPGTGLALAYIREIMRYPKISRLVYIATKTESEILIENCVKLCSRKEAKFRPFKLVTVTPVDLLPQTAQIYLVLMFERWPIQE